MRVCRPVLRLNPIFAIGVSLDQGCVHAESFSPNEAFTNAPRQNAFEKGAEEIAITKTTVPVLGKGGVIWGQDRSDRARRTNDKQGSDALLGTIFART